MRNYEMPLCRNELGRRNLHGQELLMNSERAHQERSIVKPFSSLIPVITSRSHYFQLLLCALCSSFSYELGYKMLHVFCVRKYRCTTQHITMCLISPAAVWPWADIIGSVAELLDVK